MGPTRADRVGRIGGGADLGGRFTAILGVSYQLRGVELTENEHFFSPRFTSIVNILEFAQNLQKNLLQYHFLLTSHVVKLKCPVRH